MGRSEYIRVKASGFPPCFPGRKIILKSNSVRNSFHLACLLFIFLVVVKCSRSLWSVKIKVGASTDPSSNVQVSEALTIANNLSQILHNYTLQESFFIDIKATGPRIPALSY